MMWWDRLGRDANTFSFKMATIGHPKETGIAKMVPTLNSHKGFLLANMGKKKYVNASMEKPLSDRSVPISELSIEKPPRCVSSLRKRGMVSLMSM